jgi:cytochrome P450
MPMTLLSILGAIVTLCLAFPLIRMCLSSQFRTSFPRASKMFAAAVMAGVAILTALVMWAPTLSIAVGAVSLPIHAYLWWRSRPSYGAEIGLPLGSLAMAPLEPWTERDYFLKVARRLGPVFKMSHFFSPLICVTDLPTAFAILKEQDDVSLRAPDPPFARFLPCGFIRGMVPDKHRIYRKMVMGGVVPQIFRVNEEALRGIVSEALSDIAQQSQTNPSGVWTDPHGKAFLLKVMLQLTFGIGPTDPNATPLTEYYGIISDSIRRRAAIPSPPEDRRVMAAIESVRKLVERPVGATPLCYRDQILLDDPDAANDPVLPGLLIYMTQLAASDLSGLLQWLFKRLAEHPHMAALIREREGYADWFVRESLRSAQSEHLYRKILKDFTHGGYHFPKGWMLRVCVWEGHQNVETFHDPDAFRPERFENAAFTRNEYGPFGNFRRSCFGEQLTIDLGAMLLREICRNYELSSPSPGQEIFDGWHWSPGFDFRIRLTPRSPVT